MIQRIAVFKNPVRIVMRDLISKKGLHIKHSYSVVTEKLNLCM